MLPTEEASIAPLVAVPRVLRSVAAIATSVRVTVSTPSPVIPLDAYAALISSMEPVMV